MPGLHLPAVWRVMGQANYWWIIPGVAVYMVGLWARTWRWHFMLRHLKPVTLRRLFPVVCIGYFGNNIYPFRAGEVMRAYVLWQREEIPITSSLATVIIERVFDGLVMLLFVFLALPFAPIPRGLSAVCRIRHDPAADHNCGFHLDNGAAAAGRGPVWLARRASSAGTDPQPYGRLL